MGGTAEKFAEQVRAYKLLHGIARNKADELWVAHKFMETCHRHPDYSFDVFVKEHYDRSGDKALFE